MELKRVEFALERRGYSPAQVEDYIAYLVSRYNELEKSYDELDKKYRETKIKLEEATNEDSAFSAVIVNAQKMADAIIKDAKDKARAVNGSLEASCDEIISEYALKVKAERDKLQRAENAVAEFKESLYRAYKEHVGAIDLIMPDATTKDKRMSEATDGELVDLAFDLAKNKYEEAEASEAELSSEQQSSEE